MQVTNEKIPNTKETVAFGNVCFSILIFYLSCKYRFHFNKIADNYYQNIYSCENNNNFFTVFKLEL